MASRDDKVLLLMRIIVVVYLILFFAPLTWPQQHLHHEHAGMSMSADEPTAGMLNDWKRESEGNHHLIGLLIALSGLFILTQDILAKKSPAIGYVWPACFLLSGFFVLVYSDTELWPFGPKPWIQGTITNPEVIQHKLFAIVLLAVGLIEIQRVRRCLKLDWVKWVFPILAVTGSIMLPFHSHSSGMRGPNHMAIMARIQNEHLSYATTGFCIGVVKGLAEVSTKWQIVFAKVWPMLMVVLGILLMCYIE
jgi:copper resistance protein D